MPTRTALLLAAALAALWCSPASAQTPDWCSLEGERIRVHTTTDFTPEGVSLGCTDESLLIRPDAGDGSRRGFVDRLVSFTEVESVDVSRGFEKHVLRPILLAGALGGVTFGGFAYLTGEDGASCGTGYCVRLTRKRKTVWGFVAGVVLGVGGGLAYGLTQQSEIWRPWPQVPLEGTRVTLRPLAGYAGDVGVGLILRF